MAICPIIITYEIFRNVKNSAYDNVSKLKYWLYKTNLVEGKIDYIIRKAEKVISEPDQGHDKLSLKEVDYCMI